MLRTIIVDFNEVLTKFLIEVDPNLEYQGMQIVT